VIILATILAAAASASPSPAPDDSILGTWRGTSTCVDRQRHPACKDEVVLYEFRRKAAEEGAVTLKADKIVEGQVVPMGELDCRWDGERRSWTSEFREGGRAHSVELRGAWGRDRGYARRSARQESLA